MVLEAIVNAVKAEEKPWDMVLLGTFYASLAIALALWVFKEQTSLVMLILTVMGVTPLMINILKLEEKKEIELETETQILKQHSKAIIAYGGLFLGFTFAFSLWYAFVPGDLLHYIFKVQSSTLSELTGNANLVFSGQMNLFTTIFFNNVKVMIFCIIFSLIYGMGAIFVLTWNASVLGTAVGTLVRNIAATSANAGGFATIGIYFKGYGLSIIRYSLHGIPEIGAYLIAGIAGGIISVAVVNHHFLTKKFDKILLDSANLFIMALFIIFIAAVLEVWVTPKFFGLF